MLQNLQPATSDMNLGMHDVVESHALERNKYKHQAPQFEFKDPDLEGQILAINELLYDWEHGHAPSGAPVYWASFDGTDDFIDVPDHDDLNFGDTLTDEPFSLSAWVVFANPSVNQAIMGKYNENVNSEYLLFTNSGLLQFNIYDEITTSTTRLQSKTNSAPFDAGKLYNITATYDGSGLGTGVNLYVDGTLVPQTRQSGSAYTAMHNTNVNFRIGSTVAGTLDFSRNMRHVMVFDAELQLSDVTQLLSLYDQGSLNVTADTLTKYSNIVSWWKLDEADLGSSTATDAISGHNGTFSGDAQIVLEKRIRSQAENCLWWQDRAERDGILAISGAPNDNREELKERTNTVVSGSTYVLRKFRSDHTNSQQIGKDCTILVQIETQTKIKICTKIVNSGKEIRIEKSDIYEFKQCDDVINPQQEKYIQQKQNTTTTNNYLDADADMILPFSLYSSSVGTDFNNFKDNLRITNNHDDHSGVLQSRHFRERCMACHIVQSR